jgi:hypothetical protein
MLNTLLFRNVKHFYKKHFLSRFLFHVIYFNRHFFPLWGAPISAQTLYRPEFAVDIYSFTQGVLCLHQFRRVNNPGKLYL